MSRQGKAHLPWWPSSIVSWRPLDTMCAKEIAVCSAKHGLPSIMNFGQGSAFGFYKYAFAARPYACRAELGWESQTEGQRPYGKMARDAQGQMFAAGGVQYARQSLRATIEKLVTCGTTKSESTMRLVATHRHKGARVSSARLHVLQWCYPDRKGIRKDRAFPVSRVRSLQSNKSINLLYHLLY